MIPNHLKLTGNTGIVTNGHKVARDKKYVSISYKYGAHNKPFEFKAAYGEIKVYKDKNKKLSRGARKRLQARKNKNKVGE